MSVFKMPIATAIILFPILAALLIVPYMMYIGIKHNNISKFKTFIFFTFIYYLLTAFFLTILPLPVVDEPRYRVNYQLKLFSFVGDIFREANIKELSTRSLMQLLTGRAFLQAFFNILLTLPLGVYLRYYFKKSLKTTILLAFLASLFVEVTQLTGIYGIYKYPYRLFDVDDLLLNTLGGIIGFYIAPIIQYVLPDLTYADDKSVDYKQLASFTKRVIAFSLDWMLFKFLFSTDSSQFIKFILLGGFYFVLIPYLTKGITFGGFIMGIRIKAIKGRLELSNLAKRFGVIILGFGGINHILSATSDRLAINDSNMLLFFMFIQLVFNILCFIHVVTHIKENSRILFFDRFSETYIVSQ